MGDNNLPILTISDKGVLKHHILSLHEKEKPYFEEKDNRNKHIKRTYQKKRKFQCKTCDESFLQNAILIEHITSFHEGIQPYTKRRDLSVHESEKKNPFNCHICNGIFAEKNDLNKHIDSVHERKPYQCITCGARFSQNDNLQAHILSVHTCPVCDKCFSSKSNLKTHVESVHEKKKPYQCSTCNATFTQQHSLTTHVASVSCHNPLRRYKRTVRTEKDETAHKKKKSLNQHVETVPEKKKLAKPANKWTCSSCDASFDQKKALRAHFTKNHHPRITIYLNGSK